MTDWTTVCNLADIDPDTGVCALYNGEQVALFRWGSTETVYAINNFDPFQTPPLSLEYRKESSFRISVPSRGNSL